MSSISRTPFSHIVNGVNTNDRADGYQFTPFMRISAAAEFVEKLHSLKIMLMSDILACDAKWSLFVAAALHYRYDALLKPPPAQFVCEIKGLNINAVIFAINDTPKLNVLLQMIVDEDFDELKTEVVDLLHWVLLELHNPILRTVPVDEMDVVLQLLGNQVIKKTKPSLIFEVCPVKKEQTNTRQRSSKIALYGGKLCGYFSILHEGFKHAKSLEPGEDELSLCTNLEKALESSPIGAGWGASICGPMISCVALCEYINNPEFVTSESEINNTQVHVAKDELVRPRYLLFYAFPVLDDTSLTQKCLDCISRHKYGLSVGCYALMLVGISIITSDFGGFLKHFIRRKGRFLYDFFKKIISDKAF